MSDNEKQFENFVRGIKFDDSPDYSHRDRLEQGLLTAIQKQPRRKEQPFEIWRIIMKSRITKLATAGVIIIAVMLGLTTILEQGATPAYAIEQTIEAMQDITTVHMFCRDWDNRRFEMWMALNTESGLPDYCYSYCPDYEVTNISTPTVSYQYNKRMNQVIVNKGKLYHFDVRFDKMFEDLLETAKENENNVKIYREANPVTGRKLIIVVAEENKDSAWKFLIDPETKLPIEMHCLKSNQPGMFIRDIDEIYFNEELPEGIFDFQIPEGAVVSNVDEEAKLLSDPNYGISSEGLTQQEAAEQIASEYWQAIINVDLEKVKKVYPSTNTNRTEEEIRAKYKEVFGDYMPIELVEVGQLYVEHNCGLGKVLPCIVKFEDGSLKEFKIIVKFRDIDGESSCVIAGHYGYPVEVE